MAGMLEGKVILVTGAARGIGRGSALLFAREGARIALVDATSEGVEETAELIVRAGGEAVAIRADISRSAEVDGMLEATVMPTADWMAPSTTLASTARWSGSAGSSRPGGRKRRSTECFRST